MCPSIPKKPSNGFKIPVKKRMKYDNNDVKLDVLFKVKQKLERQKPKPYNIKITNRQINTITKISPIEAGNVISLKNESIKKIGIAFIKSISI